jgi:hypothetical protein
MQCGRVMSFFLCSSSLSSLIRFIKNRKKRRRKKEEKWEKIRISNSNFIERHRENIDQKVYSGRRKIISIDSNLSPKNEN